MACLSRRVRNRFSNCRHLLGAGRSVQSDVDSIRSCLIVDAHNNAIRRVQLMHAILLSRSAVEHDPCAIVNLILALV
jgi:hypothetical protein